MTAECVFGDWTFDSTAAPVCAYRTWGQLPLRWDGSRLREVKGTEALAIAVPWVALAAHWAKEHTEILEVMVGPVVLDTYPRSGHLL